MMSVPDVYASNPVLLLYLLLWGAVADGKVLEDSGPGV